MVLDHQTPEGPDMLPKEIIDRHQADIAFIVGNGINRYPGNPGAISWEHLLMQLWDRFAPDRYRDIPQGMTITEFYDLLEIANSNKSRFHYQIQRAASELLCGWSALEHHKAFMQKAKAIEAPVLTTNFDPVLPGCLDLELRHLDTRRFTDYYPWSSYYSDRPLEEPAAGFGVWYINGLVRYPRSIRLGLSHYMGSVEKARQLLHKGQRRLFNGRNKAPWNGSHTWLHILFHKPLFVFGLGLEENEVFLRWLLIERAKYYKRFPERARPGWYAALHNELPDNHSVGKARFLQAIGLEPAEAGSYDDIYSNPWT